MTSSFYRGAQGMLLVYDITNRKSFENLEGWYSDVQKHAQENEEIPAILIGNKCDLEESRSVGIEEGTKFSTEKSKKKIFYFVIIFLHFSKKKKKRYHVS